MTDAELVEAMVGRTRRRRCSAERPVAPDAGEVRSLALRGVSRRGATARTRLRRRRPRRPRRRARRRRRRRRQRPARAVEVALGLRRRSRRHGHDRRPAARSRGDPRTAPSAGAPSACPRTPSTTSVVPGLDVGAAHRPRRPRRVPRGPRHRLGQGPAPGRRAQRARRSSGWPPSNRTVWPTLSGGNIQRVMLARAFGAESELRRRRLPEPRPRHRHDPADPGAPARTAGRAAPACCVDLRGPRRAARAVATGSPCSARRRARRRSSSRAPTDRYEIGRLMLGGDATASCAAGADGRPRRWRHDRRRPAARVAAPRRAAGRPCGRGARPMLARHRAAGSSRSAARS